MSLDATDVSRATLSSNPRRRLRLAASIRLGQTLAPKRLDVRIQCLFRRHLFIPLGKSNMRPALLPGET